MINLTNDRKRPLLGYLFTATAYKFEMNFTTEQAAKAQRRSRGIAVLFL
jgi:hypothetical protein